MGNRRLGALAVTLMALCLSAPAAFSAQRVHRFRPRIGPALGIMPPLGHQDFATGTAVPVVYHGGSVMKGVTVHTIFWAPSGYRFSGPPPGSSGSYEGLIQQFLTDVAHDSGTPSNLFSVLSQYPDRSGSGSYRVSYSAAADSIDDPQPYPAASDQCASPAGVSTCVTDVQIQQEIDRVISARDPSGRGLHDLWLLLLPPNVDTCTSPGQCGTNAYAGYHSLSNLGHGPTVYSVIVDPLIELVPPSGSDPQGNPEAEVSITTVAHEAVEAITDPEGQAWMDPNGFETGDKCQNPEIGTPLGYAANGSPYNQVINGDNYLIQGMWSNTASGCVESSTSTSSALPLATVSLKQFSPLVTGNIGTRRPGVSVTVILARTGVAVASGRATTGADGSWSTVLRSIPQGRPRAPGDDRDEILIRYGANGPALDFVQTGNGGNPFTASGWTGWFDLDHGYAIGQNAVLLSPCTQTGVLDLVVDGRPTEPPVEQCQIGPGVAAVSTGTLGAGTTLSFSSEDNRAVTLANPNGALIKLTVPLGEPGSVSAVDNSQVLFAPSGFPACTADLRVQRVRCTGLVPGSAYALTRGRGHATRRASADDNGAAVFGHFPGAGGVVGGDVLALVNGHHRTLSTLHVAHIRVDLLGNRTVINTGRCEPGEYYGPPLSTPPTSPGVGLPGTAGTGTICPRSGNAAGLSSADMVQSDDLSAGQTRTEVPVLESTAPASDATLYGPFVALAQTGLPGPNGAIDFTRTRVALSISRSGSRAIVFRAANVAGGVAVKRLPTGTYIAKWVVIDAAGDTRTVRTAFVEAG